MRAFGFYPFDKEELEKQIKEFSDCEKRIENSKGLILPHAGYSFSGSVLGKTLSCVDIDKQNITIFGPNHSSNETFVDSGEWKTPLGEVKTYLDVDLENHSSSEHSIEVIVPFLQYKLEDFSLTPVVVGSMDFGELTELSKKIHTKDSFFIASSDFFHYGPDFGYDPAYGKIEDKVDWVKERDEELEDMICDLKPAKFYNTVKNNGYTVCGFRTITLLMILMKKLNAKKAERIDYKTSYEVRKNHSFVSYQGFVFV